MPEELPSSTHYLQKRFQEWFGEPIPTNLPFPAETDHSIEDLGPADLPFSVEVDHTIEGLGPTDLPFPAEADHSVGDPAPTDLTFPVMAYPSYYETRTSNNELPKLLELLGFGFSGAVLFGTGVGFIILTINISLFEWYGIHWPGQFFVIFLAMVIGFWGGLFKGSIDKLHEKYPHRDGL